MAVDENKLNAFMGQFAQDLGATVQAGMVVLGHRLGLYRAMAGAGPLSPAGPVYLPGAFQLALASLKGEPRIAEAFRTGAGVGWHEQDPEVFDGCEMFFAPGYRANLVQSWIPALDGVEAKLQAGARVADVGCGHGASTIIMAKAYPKSTLTGFDYHQRSIDWARKAGVSDRVRFEAPGARRLRRGRLRPGGDLRLLPRHGRPRRGGRPHPPRPRRRRHLAAGRAGRPRPPGGQPQPGRAAVLRLLGAAVRAQRPLPAAHGRAGQPGRRGPHPRADRRRRVRPLPPRRPRPRSI